MYKLRSTDSGPNINYAEFFTNKEFEVGQQIELGSLGKGNQIEQHTWTVTGVSESGGRHWAKWCVVICLRRNVVSDPMIIAK